ncbi:Hydroxyphenylpyruvate reductase [Nymphon striatum]|nr:Hydroxyphenylpyruvate reductase [Nymphon striatum]
MSTPSLLMIGGATDEMMARLTPEFTIHKLSEISDLDAWASEFGSSVETVMTNGHDGVPASIMTALPNLKAVSGYGVGYDAVDTDACVARGIKVSHTPNVLNGEMAKTIGILGLGRIGQEIADRLSVFNPTIVYHTRSKKDVPYTYYGDLVEMARACDVLVCITPGGPSTNKIVNKDVLEALGPKGMLINVSRGSVVDEAALIAALDSGKLGLAGLDVFEGEPHIPDALKASDRTVLLPHVGSATHETRAAMGALTVDNLLQWKKDGTLKTPVPECAHL